MAASITVWGIHTMDDPLFLNQHLIAIGWEKMGNLSAIPASRDAYKEAYVAAYPDAKKRFDCNKCRNAVSICP